MPVTLFANADYGLPFKTFYTGFHDVQELAPVGNDQVSSLIIGPKTEVILYEDWKGFGKQYRQVNTTNSDMHINWIGAEWNDRVSSLRVISLKENTEDGLEGAIIYEGPDFSGKYFHLKSTLNELPPHSIKIGRFFGWDNTDKLNNNVSSIKIGTGYSAIFYDDAYFSGNQVAITENTARFNADWDNKASSVKIYKRPDFFIH